MFFNGSVSDEQMEKYSMLLGDGYAAIDTDMISSEKIEITRCADVVLPFVIILFGVSLSAVVSLSVISFLNGLKEY